MAKTERAIKAWNVMMTQLHNSLLFCITGSLFSYLLSFLLKFLDTFPTQFWKYSGPKGGHKPVHIMNLIRFEPLIRVCGCMGASIIPL